MTRLNPYDLDPDEARHAFANFNDEVFSKIRSEMWDINHEISYILHHYYHPINLDNIDVEVVSYLEKNGLKRTDKTATKPEKANPDYYLAAYFALETIEHFFKSHQTMSFDSQINNLCYAKKQLAIVETLSPIGIPKNNQRNTSGQSMGAKIKNTKKYQLTRQRAQIEWEKYKKTISEWHAYKSDPLTHEQKIDELLKSFEQLFFNSLSSMQYRNSNSDNLNLLNERYTDSMANPPLAIGWIKELEEFPNRQKEHANKKRLNRKFKDSPYQTLEMRLKNN